MKLSVKVSFDLGSPVELAIALLALWLTGPGRFTLVHLLVKTHHRD
jgi:hypothetical protein